MSRGDDHDFVGLAGFALDDAPDGFNVADGAVT